VADALSLIGRTGERSHEAELYRLEGELILQREDSRASTHSLSNPVSERAEAAFLKAISIARQQGAKSLELRTITSLSRLWRGDKRQQAYETLAAIYGSFTEGFATKDLKEARALLQELG
jgi:predicted ATPase